MATLTAWGDAECTESARRAPGTSVALALAGVSASTEPAPRAAVVESVGLSGSDSTTLGGAAVLAEVEAASDRCSGL